MAFFQPIHGPEIKLIDTSHYGPTVPNHSSLAGYLLLLAQHRENLERAPKRGIA